MDYGEPQSDMVEGPPGVWTREWSKASVKFDCTAAGGAAGSIRMK
jgi:hypothetical protein